MSRRRQDSAGSVAFAVAIMAVAATVATGCSRSQLRVIVQDPNGRAGTVQVTTITSRTDPGRSLSHGFDGRSSRPADLVFTFAPKSRWSYMVAVVTHFTPVDPRANECILTCSHYMQLMPGHSHRVETPIVILPNACSEYFRPGSSDSEQAASLCAEAANLIQVPNCTFVVTDEHTCTLVCPSTAPDDSDPGAPAHQSIQARDDDGPPITPPRIVAADAGSDTGRLDAGPADAGYVGGTVDNDVVSLDSGVRRPSICGFVDLNCDGFADMLPCPSGLVCDANECRDPCVEGGCFASQMCTLRGTCVETSCLSVSCGLGEVCRDGTCIDVCAGVTCPDSQVCRAGLCLPPCPDR